MEILYQNLHLCTALEPLCAAGGQYSKTIVHIRPSFFWLSLLPMIFSDRIHSTDSALVMNLPANSYFREAWSPPGVRVAQLIICH